MERKTQQSGHTKELLLLEIIEDRVVILLLSRLILSPENPYKGKPFTTGCYQSDDDCSFKTEILDLYTRRWSDGPDYPFTGPDGSANDRK